MGNPKNKYVPKNQKALNKSICKSSSTQKENMAKNKKTRASKKPNPDDSIAMSKQLLLKKNIARTQRQSSTKAERICPNGKPIPSLSELEKMFEDSDDSDQTPTTTPQKPTYTTSTHSNMNEKLEFSPTTINKITERLLGSIQNQNLPDPSEVLEATSLFHEKTPPSPILPLKKRKVPEVPYIVGCKNRPQVTSKPSTNFCKGYDDYGVVASGEDPDDQIPSKRAKKSRIPNYSKSIFNAHSDDIAERLIKDDAGGLSDASSDSNKTIEYDPILLQNPKPRTFSPLPSTSTDSETFKKNDELFYESLREMELMNASTLKKNNDVRISPKSSLKEKENNVQNTNETTPKKQGDLPTTRNPPQKNEDDVQIIGISYDTIVIEDNCEKTIDIQNTNNAVDTNDIEIIEPVTSAEVTRPKKDITTHEIPYDEDCMIIASEKSVQVDLDDEPIIIDDEYSSINMEFDSVNNETIEIIDVDEIIAENKSILDKWKGGGGAVKLTKMNGVVEVSTASRNWTTLQDVTPSTSQATQDRETPRNNQPAVIPNTTLQTNLPPSPINSLNWPNRNSATNIWNNRRQTPSVSDSQGYVFQSILSDFFADFQHNRTLNNTNENASAGAREFRLHTATDTTNSVTILSTPAITVTPFPNNTFQDIGDTSQSDFDDSCNSSSNETRQTSTLILPPSPVPVRNIGDCPICLDPLSSNGIASTLCGHVFCLKCIKASIKTNGKKCPTCRKALKGPNGGYHQIYL